MLIIPVNWMTAIGQKFATLEGAYVFRGSILFVNLPNVLTKAMRGYVYNIENQFTTDARFIEGIGNVYAAGTNVAVADVSYYVTEDSIIDKEARERGTSVYLVDRVLPMLPERLSNGICSLNAGVDRLSMACEMHINREGKVLDYEIFPAIIHVRHRLSYNIVREIIAGDEESLK